MLIKINKTIFLFIYFLLLEIKEAEIKLVNFYNTFHQVKFFKYLKSFFLSEKKIFSNEDLNEYLKVNTEINNINDQKIFYSNKKIVVESLINHPLYTLPNCIIGKKLSETYKLDCVGIIKEGDLVAENIMKSFGFKHILKVNKTNFLLRLFFFIKVIKILGSNKSIKWLIKYKKNRVEIGKSVYEHYVRFKKDPGPKKITITFYKFFLEALIYNYQFKKLFKNLKISFWVQSELQFIPHRIFFQNALIKKAKIFIRFGDIRDNSIKISTSYKERNANRTMFNKKLFHYLFKKYKKNIIKESNIKINQNLKKFIGREVYQLINKKKKSKKFKDKKDICKYFNWKIDKPIVIILSHELTDGNFANKWNLFLDDKDWLVETLNKIKKVNSVNWIVKSHPSESHYNSNVNAKTIFNEIIKDQNNIKLFPLDYNVQNIYKFVSVAITSHGTPGYQYPALGVPTIVCGDTSYYGLGFNIEPKTKKKYFDLLYNINSIKSLSKIQEEKGKCFWYLFNFLGRVEIPSIYYSDITMKYDKKNFWKESLKLLKLSNNYKGNFFKSFKYQLINNNSNLINLKKMSLWDKNFKLKNFN